MREAHHAEETECGFPERSSQLIFTLPILIPLTGNLRN